MAYDYDTHPFFEGYLKGENTFQRYLEELKRQEEIYPENYIKMRNLENHDFGRFAEMVQSDMDKIRNWTAMVFFLKGSTMVYAGQEFCDTNRPDLFDVDKVNWDGADISPLIKKLRTIVDNNTFSRGLFNIRITERDVFVGSFLDNENEYVGIFNVGKETGDFDITLSDSEYVNLIDESVVNVKNGMMTLRLEPIIIKVK